MSLIIWRIERDRKGGTNSSFIIKQTRIKTLYRTIKPKLWAKCSTDLESVTWKNELISTLTLYSPFTT